MQGKKILLASDHGGVALKEALVLYLQGQGYKVQDFGVKDAQTSVDYPDKAFELVQAMQSDEDARGVLICTTGIGMSIAANRFPFIRGALVLNEDMAYMCRAHNNANVLIFGAKYTSIEVAQKCLDAFLKTPFDGGRHERRVQKLTQLGEKA